VIVVDTGAVLALLDADDRHHAAVRALYEEQSSRWLLPWAILPEVDYLALSQLGPRVEEAFLADLAAGGFRIEWGTEADLVRAHALCVRHRALKLGLVDAVVIAVAERRRAQAIATLDLRHFGAVRIAGAPKLYPRDL
jgi:uncharacterized protein